MESYFFEKKCRTCDGVGKLETRDIITCDYCWDHINKCKKYNANPNCNSCHGNPVYTSKPYFYATCHICKGKGIVHDRYY